MSTKISQHNRNGVRNYNTCKKNNPIRPQRKRLEKNQFDVSMGANDGAEICELIHTY